MNVGAQRPRQDKPNYLRSCEACRTSKAKCTASAEPEITECQRCAKLGKQCIFAEAQPRQKRGKHTYTRVAEVEKKLDNIYALLQNGGAVKSKSQSPPASSTAATTMAASAAGPEMPGGHFHEGATPFSLDTISSALPTTPPSPPAADSRQDVIDQGLLSVNEAEELIHIYRTESQGFPFVYLAPDLPLETLRHERPFLLLAVLESACIDNPALQAKLDKELRESLGTMVIVDGQLSLDLLEGLLVYLAWYHYQFRPFRQQVYQLIQLAVAMCVDLEIGKPPRKTTGAQSSVPTRTIKICHGRVKVVYPESEAMRAYIGCYYLSSAMAMSLRKPNGMRYGDYLEKCARCLEQAQETPTDSELVYYVRLQKLAEEVGTMFGYGEPSDQPSLGPERIQLTVRAFNAQLKDLWNSYPPNVRQNSYLMLLHYNTASYVHEVILHVDVDNSHHASWQNSGVRTDLLLGCLESTKAFLDAFLALPPRDFQRMAALEVFKVAYNFLVLGKLTLGAGPGFDGALVLERADLLAYFDAFLERARRADTTPPSARAGPGVKSAFWHFGRVYAYTKRWFAAQLRRGGNRLDGSHSRTDPKDLSPLQLIDEAEEESMINQHFRKEGAETHGPGEIGVHPGMEEDMMMDFSLTMQDPFWAEVMSGWPETMGNELPLY